MSIRQCKQGIEHGQQIFFYSHGDKSISKVINGKQEGVEMYVEAGGTKSYGKLYENDKFMGYDFELGEQLN